MDLSLASHRDGEAFTDRGEAKMMGGDFEGRIADFDQSLQRQPNCARALRRRGEAKMMLRDFEETFDDFSKALKRNPTMPWH